MSGMWRFLKKPEGPALAFMVSGMLWFIIGTLYGLVSAIDLVAPDFFANIAPLVFGRGRPTHVNTVLYGFVTEVLVGCGLYYVPALLRTKLWSPPAAWLSWLLWNITVLSGPICFAGGHTQGREYTEYIWAFDVTFTLAIVLLAVNIVMTIANRRENSLYVSVWYFTGMLLWTAGSYPIGNVMWHPSTGAVAGILDTVILWFYGHNLPGLVLTPLAVGAAYYVMPRIAQAPLWSHTLSLVGFWTLVALYTHIGGHHVPQGPIPNWLKAMSTIDSMAMVIPVFVALGNLWLSIRGRGGKLLADPAGRFVLAGTVWYLITCVQGPIQSLPAVQRVTHFNNWVIGHSHIAILGFAGYIALGAMWHILPLLSGRELYSRRLVNLQFGLITFGLVGFFMVLTTAGLIQGGAWNNGQTIYRVLPEIAPYMFLRAVMGVLIIAAAFVGFYNLWMTLRRGRVIEPELREEALS
jgi:cbb3-type cytochrome c oxidase subunit I